MKNWTLLFALFFAAPAFSQTTVFAPKGAVWHQSPWQAACFPFNLYTWTADEDTLILGTAARAIHCNEADPWGVTQIDSLTRFVSVQGDKVLWLAGGQFVTLFDFGAMPGDTIESIVQEPHLLNTCHFSGPVPGGGPFKYWIDSVGTLELGGQTLRYQKTSPVVGSGWFMPSTIVERIGVLEAENWYGMGQGFCTLLGCPTFLRCYSDPEVMYVSPEWLSYGNQPCDYLAPMPGTGESDKMFTPLIPNPASDFVELPFEPDEIRLANPLGQVADVPVFDKKMDVSQLAPGLWFLSLKKGGSWIGFRLIVQ